MDLRPEQYKELSQFLLNRAKFQSFSALINAAILICTSFKLKETLIRCPYCKDETFFNLKQSKCTCINCDM